MVSHVKRLLLLALCAGSAIAQAPVRNNLTVGAEPAAPLFRSSRFWTTRPAIKARYGYRFLTNLQAHVDFMTTFSPGKDMFRTFRLLEGDIGGGALYSLSFGGDARGHERG